MELTPDEEKLLAALEAKKKRNPLFQDQAMNPEEKILALQQIVAQQQQQLKEFHDAKDKVSAKAAENMTEEERLVELLRLKREQAKRKHATDWAVNVIMPDSAGFGGFEEKK